jgi:hypothetical protein
MPPMFLTGTAAAGAIAWINSLGNLGGFFGPWYVGLMQDPTGSYGEDRHRSTCTVVGSAGSVRIEDDLGL